MFNIILCTDTYNFFVHILPVLDPTTSESSKLLAINCTYYIRPDTYIIIYCIILLSIKLHPMTLWRKSSIHSVDLWDVSMLLLLFVYETTTACRFTSLTYYFVRYKSYEKRFASTVLIWKKTTCPSFVHKRVYTQNNVSYDCDSYGETFKTFRGTAYISVW